jgi:hypothetical protein
VKSLIPSDCVRTGMVSLDRVWIHPSIVDLPRATGTDCRSDRCSFQDKSRASINEVSPLLHERSPRRPLRLASWGSRVAERGLRTKAHKCILPSPSCYDFKARADDKRGVALKSWREVHAAPRQSDRVPHSGWISSSPRGIGG